ncbi:MAG: tol-pal system protein YbgF [Deltaproteobacteria bacterium]|nr:tol-pal system protein YbgF [Deltaproteobacteria bacterium]
MKIKPIILYSLTAVLFTGCAALNEKDKKLEQMDRQIAELRASIDEKNSKIEDLNSKFSLLHEKIDTAKADIDKLSNPVVPEGLKVVPLTEAPDGAIKAEELKEQPRPVKAEANFPSKAEPVKEDASPEELYNKGQDLFLKGSFNESRAVLSRLLKIYPDNALADNALYWIAESYYSEKDFEKALGRFKEVAEKYSNENKAPDALLKAGFSYLEMENFEKGRESLERVIKRYPGTEAAAKAKKALAKLPASKK